MSTKVNDVNHLLKLYNSKERPVKMQIKKSIIAALDISEPGFHKKIRENKWKTLEQIEIARILNISVNELFPKIEISIN